MKIPDFLNQPIVVVIIAVTYFFILQSAMGKTSLQAEIRDAYKELQRIADDLSKTDEPGKVKEVVSNFANQVMEGFKAGFRAGSKEDLAAFREAKKNIIIRDTGRAPSSWKTREKFIAILDNRSKYPVSNIKVNLSCYSKDGKLIDSLNDWISEIKLLEPNESVSIAVDRSLGDSSLSDEELAIRKAHSFEMKVISFDIKKLED